MDLIWFMFGMNGHKILKWFRKEKRDFSRVVLSCPATDLNYEQLLYETIENFIQYLDFFFFFSGILFSIGQETVKKSFKEKLKQVSLFLCGIIIFFMSK